MRDLEVQLNGEIYLLAENRAARQWEKEIVPAQDADMLQEASIRLSDFSEGGGFTFGFIDAVYERADGWDASTPGKLTTWAIHADGTAVDTADRRGWWFTLGGYFYLCRGRYVQKYQLDDTPGSTLTPLEIHDLGANHVCPGRPAIFDGAGYVPRYDENSPAYARFHQLTTVAAVVVEQQTLTTTGSPTGGTYTVTFDGKTTSALAFDADAVTVQAALRAIPGLELVTVALTAGSSPNFTHTVTLTGVAGAMGASSPPEFTVDDAALTGGSSPEVTPATTVAGTGDTWTLGPANRLPICFRSNWQNKMAGAWGNGIWSVADDPMTEADWFPNDTTGYVVGDPGHPITDLAVAGKYLIVGKTSGPWRFEEDLTTVPVIPSLFQVVDEQNCVGMEEVNGEILIPHKVGLIAWNWETNAYRFIGPEQEGVFEGDLSRGWGRAASIASYGKYTFYSANDEHNILGALGSLQPSKGGRDPIPHIHFLSGDGERYEGVFIVNSEVGPVSTLYASVVSDDSAVGTLTWGTTDNGEGAADDAVASVTGPGTTHYLKALGFNQMVPGDATITGIELGIRRRAD